MLIPNNLTLRSCLVRPPNAIAKNLFYLVFFSFGPRAARRRNMRSRRNQRSQRARQATAPCVSGGRAPANAASARPAVFDALTPREFEIVKLMAQRLSNREIAEKLYLSEGSIRQYVNQIYTKLQIAGEPRAKRKLLLDLLADKN